MRYLVHCIDKFSNFVMLDSVRRKTCEEVTQAIMTMLFRFGPPRYIQTDNGGEFGPLLERTVKAEWQWVRFIHGRPYWPRSQGTVERINQVLGISFLDAQLIWMDSIHVVAIAFLRCMKTVSQSFHDVARENGMTFYERQHFYKTRQSHEQQNSLQCRYLWDEYLLGLASTFLSKTSWFVLFYPLHRRHKSKRTYRGQ